MFKVALRGLQSRLGRVALSAIAVVLGVGFISGVQVLSDTIEGSASDLIAQSLTTQGAVVRSTSTQQSAGALVRQTVPSTMVEVLGGIDGVDNVEGVVQGFGRLISRDNAPLDPGPVPTFVLSWIDDPRLSMGHLTSGSPPHTAEEVVIDSRTARDGRWAIGDEIRIQGSIGVSSFRISGIGSIGNGKASTGVRLVMMESTTAQTFTGSDGQYSYIVVSPRPGVRVDELVQRLSQSLPPGSEAISGASFVEETTDQARQSLELITRFSQSFGLIGLVVAGLTIANTFSILIAQRTRELALLRVAGATARQVTLSVIFEAAMIGLFGSVFGLMLGYGGAWLARNAIGRVLSIDGSMPSLSITTAAWGLGLGLVTTMVAATFPAVRTGRIAPIAALSDAGSDAVHISTVRKVLGVLIAVFGIGTTLVPLIITDFPSRIAAFAVGSALLVVATVLTGPLICQPVLRVLGLPLRFTRTGRLALADVIRHPKRTTATATALAVGLAVVTMVTLLTASVEQTATDTFKTRVRADIVIDGGLANPLAGGMAESVAYTVADQEGVQQLSRFRLVPAQVLTKDGSGFTGDQLVAGVDVPAFFSLVDMGVRAGSVGLVDREAIAVSSTAAKREGWQLSDPISISYPQLGVRTYRIGMIYDTQLPAVSVLLPMEAIDEVSSAALRQDSQIYLSVTPGASVRSMVRTLDAALDVDAPTASAKPVDEWVDSGINQLNTATNAIYALLGFAMLLSLFGIVNTLSLSMTERTREIALLRAIGITRRQLIRQVLAEGALIAALGTVFGLTLGVWIGGGLIAVGKDTTSIALDLPVVRLLVIAAVGSGAGVLAALFPAWRAARLPITETIARS